jgi:hypothetical protein
VKKWGTGLSLKITTSTTSGMKKELKIEDFSASLFWDVDKSQLDFEKNAVHVIDKAINRGTWEDFQTALSYYGREKMAAIVKNLRYMDKRTLQFSSVYFQIPITEMRCYIWQQSNPSHWDY